MEKNSLTLGSSSVNTSVRRPLEPRRGCLCAILGSDVGSRCPGQALSILRSSLCISLNRSEQSGRRNHQCGTIVHMEGRYGFHWPMQTNNQQHGPKRPRGRRCEDLCLLLRAANSCRVPGTELTSSHAMTVIQHTLYSVTLVCFFSSW